MMDTSKARFEVDLLDREVQKPIDLFNISNSLRKDQPGLEQFLLESIDGPKADRRQSILGIGVQFSLVITNGQIKLTGDKGLIETFNAYLKRLDQKTAPLFGIFQLIRMVENSGEVRWPNGTISKLPLLTIISYDAGSPEKPNNVTLTTPDLIVILPMVILALDHSKNHYSFISVNPVNQNMQGNSVKTIMLKYISDDSSYHCNILDPKKTPVHFTVSSVQYHEMVKTALDYILSGDVYQIQLGHEVLVETAEEPTLIYSRLRTLNPSPYMFYVTLPSITLMGASPELFVRIEDGVVQMRPLAGTLAKSTKINRFLLSTNPKEQAEHIMLVDLCRNDLGRISRIGSVKVPELATMEEYPSVFHLVSSIMGHLRSELDVWDAVESCFPAGTMTGTPKLRAIKIIAEQELTKRGVYAGTIAYSNGRGDIVSALIIRTLVFQNGIVSVRASAGIVADSEPKKEWNETLAKIQSSLMAVTTTRI